MTPLLSLMSAVAPLAITVMLIVLSELSRRLGAVLKLGNLHRMYYVAALCTLVSTITRLLSVGFSESAFSGEDGDTTAGLVFTLTLLTGVFIGFAVTWRYWGWLVYASDGKTLLTSRRKP